MLIEKIKLQNFRNYKDEEIYFDNNINIIYGNNAQGKTNILESIFLCSMGKSFRAKKDKDLIKFGEEKAIVELDYRRNDRNRKNKSRIRF